MARPKLAVLAVTFGFLFFLLFLVSFLFCLIGTILLRAFFGPA